MRVLLLAVRFPLSMENNVAAVVVGVVGEAGGDDLAPGGGLRQLLRRVPPRHGKRTARRVLFRALHSKAFSFIAHGAFQTH